MSKATSHSALISALAFGVAASALCLTFASNAGAAPSYTTSVTLRNIDEQLVPTELVRGDREFGGNGPRIKSNVTLSVTGDKRRILATVYFNARETKSDWSETRGTWTRTVYTAPSTRRIESILGGSYSSVDFVSKPAGFQLFGRVFFGAGLAVISGGIIKLAIHKKSSDPRTSILFGPKSVLITMRF